MLSAAKDPCGLIHNRQSRAKGTAELPLPWGSGQLWPSAPLPHLSLAQRDLAVLRCPGPQKALLPVRKQPCLAEDSLCLLVRGHCPALESPNSLDFCLSCLWLLGQQFLVGTQKDPEIWTRGKPLGSKASSPRRPKWRVLVAWSPLHVETEVPRALDLR